MPSIAGIKAGDAYVVIGALDDTGKMLSKIGRRIKMWGASLTGLGTDILFKGALAAVPGVAMLRWATDFDDMMKRVQARTGATDAQMNTLRKTAMEAGLDIGFTARDIGKIFDTLSQNKFDIGDINQMVRPIALLAKATGGGGEKDTEQATRLMAQTLNSFQLGSDSAQMVADLMAVAANKSSFALDDLTEAMAKVGPMAKAMGVGIGETVGVMAMMRNVEIEAETAGVSMRNIFLNASDDKNVKKFNDKLEALGQTVIKFTDDAGNLKHPAQLLFEVFNKVKGLGTAQRANLLGELFGKRAAVPAIAAGMSQEAFDDFMKALKNAAGEATRVSLEMEMGLGGAFRAIRNGVEQIAIVFGETLKPMMGSIREIIVSLTQRIKAWIELNPRLAAGVMLVAAGVMALGVSFIGLGIALNVVGTLFLPIGAALTLVKTGITLLVSIISGAISIVWELVGAVIGLAVQLGGVLVSAVTFAAVQAFNLLALAIEINLAMVIDLAGAFGIFGANLVALLPILAAIGIIGGAIFAAYASVKQILLGIKDLFDLIVQAASDFKNFVLQSFSAIVQTGLRVFEVLKEGMSVAFKLTAVGKFQLAWEAALSSLTVSFLEFKDTVLTIWSDISLKFDDMMSSIRRSIAKNLTGPLGLFLQAHGAIMGDIGMQAVGEKMKKGALADLNPRAEAQRRAAAGKLAAEGRADRHVEIEKARAAFRNKMRDVAPDLQDADKFLDDLKDRMKKAMAGFGGEGAGAQQLADEHIPALTELQAGTLEAAKATYEASVADEFGNIQGEMLGVQQEIAANTGRIAENLGVA